MKFVIFDIYKDLEKKNNFIDSLNTKELYKIFTIKQNKYIYNYSLKKIINLEYNFIFKNRKHDFFKKKDLDFYGKSLLKRGFTDDNIIFTLTNIKVILLCMNDMYCAHAYFFIKDDQIFIFGYRCLFFTINHIVGIDKINNLIYKLFEDELFGIYNIKVL